MDYKEQFSVDCYRSPKKVGGPELKENYTAPFRKPLVAGECILALQILD